MELFAMNPINLEAYSAQLVCYERWLREQDAYVHKRWCLRLSSSESTHQEAAIAEAVAWEYLAAFTDDVVLSLEDPSFGGPDFRFENQGNPFVVEVCSASRQAVSDASSISAERPQTAFTYSLVTGILQNRIQQKLKQIRAVKEPIPRLVFVTTLHGPASRACFGRHAVECAMTSEPKITIRRNPVTGEPQGDWYNSTDLADSVFLWRSPVLDADGNSVIKSRFEPISGFLLGGFGLAAESVRVFGGLNPGARFPFSPTLLPSVPLCTVSIDPMGRISTQWSVTEEEEERRESAERRRRIDRDPALRSAIREVEAENDRRRPVSFEDHLKAMLGEASADVHAGRVIPVSDALIKEITDEGRSRAREHNR